MRRKLVAGNWKMNMTSAQAQNFAKAVANRVPHDVEAVVFPPFPYLSELQVAGEGTFSIGAQNVSEHTRPGAYTGEVMAAMLADVGCRYVLVGHSERRQYHHDSNGIVATRFQSALSAGLIPVLCVGETEGERQSGNAEKVVAGQLDAVLNRCGVDCFEKAVIGYEPVWAIGTGVTATPEQAQQMHAFVRGHLAKSSVTISALTRIIYGGSVKPDSAASLLAQPDIDGGLVGGASLVAEDFLAICHAAQSIMDTAK